MKRLLWLLPVVWAVVLFLTWDAWAEPFLVCDPQSDADGYIYTLNGGTAVVVPYATDTIGGRTVAVIADLGLLPAGPFTYSVRAYNIWGQSSTVPFTGLKAYPGSPSNTAIAR